jgi:hypothetical protein
MGEQWRRKKRHTKGLIYQMEMCSNNTTRVFFWVITSPGVSFVGGWVG